MEPLECREMLSVSPWPMSDGYENDLPVYENNPIDESGTVVSSSVGEEQLQVVAAASGSSFRVASVTQNSIYLEWDQMDPEVHRTVYYLIRYTEYGKNNWIATGKQYTGLNAYIDKLTPGTAYQFNLHGRNIDNAEMGEWTTAGTTSGLPPTPTGIEPVDRQSNSVVIRVVPDQHYSEADYYMIRYRALDAAGAYAGVWNTTQVNYFHPTLNPQGLRVTGVQSNTNYAYQVCSGTTINNVAYYSSWSPVTTVRTRL